MGLLDFLSRSSRSNSNDEVEYDEDVECPDCGAIMIKDGIGWYCPNCSEKLSSWDAEDIWDSNGHDEDYDFR